MTSALRPLLLRLPLLVILGIGAVFLLGGRPRRVDLIYDLQGDPRPARVDVRIEDAQGRLESELSWGSGAAAEDPMPHHPLLAPGEHHLVARLVYPDGRVADVERSLRIERGEGNQVIHLP